MKVAGGTLFLLAGLTVGAVALTVITNYRGVAQRYVRWSQGKQWWSRSGLGAVQRWRPFQIVWGLGVLVVAVAMVWAGIAGLVAA